MIISIDLGTSKLCAAAIDIETARALAIRSCPNDTDIHGLADDLHEQDPVRTRDLCFDLIRQVLRDDAVAGQPVDAIGISGQMHGVLLVDPNLRSLTNLITWRDRRTAREASHGGISESLSLLGRDVEIRTGCRLATGYGAATLRWLDCDSMLPEKCTALTIAGFVAASLTGILAIDQTHAASWGILDVTCNLWDETCVTRLGLRPEVLPQIIPSGEPLAELTDSAKNELGISGPTIVCSPVGDCQASVIGCTGFSDDTIVLNLGTGGQISVPSPHGVCTEELDAWPLPFGGFLQLGAALCGGWSYAYLRQFFHDTVRELTGIELTDDAIYERMNSLAASANPGAGGAHCRHAILRHPQEQEHKRLHNRHRSHQPHTREPISGRSRRRRARPAFDVAHIRITQRAQASRQRQRRAQEPRAALDHHPHVQSRLLHLQPPRGSH